MPDKIRELGENVDNRDKRSKIILVICNILLVLAMVVSAGMYSRYVRSSQEESKTADFVKTIETMKQVSQNYLDSERGYVKNWAFYISSQDMTMEEALDFLRTINTNKDRFAHIVDMDTYDAYSSYYPKGSEEIDTYKSSTENVLDVEGPFFSIMKQMFADTDDKFSVLGKYRLQETRSMAVSVGARVSLHTDQGKKDYLLLRIIPTEVLKKSWVFPMEYTSAEVGIITNAGDYVIQSDSMKSQNFLEYIRGYNFQDDYNKVEDLRKRLQDTDSGTLEYKNFRGEDCIWYYSAFDKNSSLDILGMLNKSEIKASIDAWYIVFMVCGTLLVLILIDGFYLVIMNRKLREAARISAEASRAKTQFLSAMSHDIRTPLNAVLGMMMIAQKKSDDPEYVEDCMDKGLHSGKQLLTLINDVLDISKIESGKVILNPEQVCLDDLIHDLTEIVVNTIEQKHIRIEYDFTALPHKYIYVDKMRLNQIYVNLLTNAVKYTKPGGRVRLSLHEEDGLDDRKRTRLIFRVEDNGIGMTEEFQKTMYHTFTREVNTQVNTTQGTGLGLSIVKQVVDMMDGTITCNSAPGQGTVFTVYLDVMISEIHVRHEAADEPDCDVQGMHLLIAEDNDLNWEVANRLLKSRGITCVRAENGKSCIEEFAKQPAGTYAAILMDVHMPVMNGYEATKAIRAMEDTEKSRIPIIAMTADAFAEDVQTCLSCGMNGHIAKPIDLDKVISVLLKTIKREADIQEGKE